MNKVVKMFYDLETTGLEVGKHGIHHISGMIEVDNEIKEKFDFKVRPFPNWSNYIKNTHKLSNSVG